MSIVLETRRPITRFILESPVTAALCLTVDGSAYRIEMVVLAKSAEGTVNCGTGADGVPSAPLSISNSVSRLAAGMRSVRLLKLLIFVLLAALLGCGTQRHQPRTSDTVTLTFWNGFTGPDGATMEKIVREFNRRHPHIKVRMQIIPWATYYDKLTLGLAYGGAPDVFILHVNRFPEYACYDSLGQMDDLVRSSHLKADDFVKRAWDAGLWKGKRYAVPLDCHPQALYYNKKLFREAGIVGSRGAPKPPVDLKEFLDDARKLTRDTNGDGRPDQWGFAFTWLRTNSYTFLNQFGTNLLDGKLEHSTVSSPEACEAMQLMRDMIYKYHICPSPEGQDAWMGFQTGKVAMAIEGIYMLSSLEDKKGLEFGAAPCPLFGRKQAAWGGSHLLVMPRGLSPERRRAVWEFITYLSDHSLEWAKGGQVPVRKSILASPAFRRLEVQYQFSRELPYVVYEPPSVSYNQITPFADAAFEAVLFNIKRPREALAEASQRIDKVLARQ